MTCSSSLLQTLKLLTEHVSKGLTETNIFPFLLGAKTPEGLALVLIYVRCAPRGFLKGLCHDSLVRNGNRTEWSVIRPAT